MSQRLGLYDWSNKILADYENFHYEYLDDILNEIDNSKITKHFKWEWNGYYGFGYINLKNGIIDCDDIDCRDSHMTVVKVNFKM